MTTSKKKKQPLSLRRQLHGHFKTVFVPHKGNGYRPHLIRRYGLISVLVVIIGLQAGYNYLQSGRVLGVKQVINASELLRETNEQRAQRQLPPLQTNDLLTRAAFLKGQDMLRQQYWAHTAPDGTTPWHWYEAVGYNYAYAGENLAKNFGSAQAVMTAWMASPEHAGNIIDGRYSQVGFATVDGMLDQKPVSLVIALYGAPAAPIVNTAHVQISGGAAAPTGGQMTLLTRLGVALQSLTPAALGAIILGLLVIPVALAAHAARHKLPKALRQSWYRHHGLIKAGGMLSLSLAVIFLYGNGQI